MAKSIEDLITQKRADLNSKINLHNDYAKELSELREQETPDVAKVEEIRERKAAASAAIETFERELNELEVEKRADEQVARLQAETNPTDVVTRKADERVVVGAEPRTYQRENDPKGIQFALDVARSYMTGDPLANERLQRHMAEERVHRPGFESRAVVGTGAFTGLVVPQYLVDDFAPAAKAGRPLADAMRHHDLPAKGMVLNIGKITTETSVDVQTEGTTVSETDIDDTLLPINVQTAAGSQTLSRQAVERGEGVEDTLIDDLTRGFYRNLDSKVINQATNGLTNVATSIAYTDASPTAAELYPKLLAGPAAAEAALLDTHPGDVIAVMHSRRWYWLQSQLSSTWPLFGQPGAAPQLAGMNYGEQYGSGFRGVLPSGIPVIVDNNIGTTLGAGTEDEIYFVAQSESHLWEDPNAPLLIRAEQTQAKKLAIDLVVYGYFAYTFARRSHAQKIAGTGLIAPVFA